MKNKIILTIIITFLITTAIAVVTVYYLDKEEKKNENASSVEKVSSIENVSSVEKVSSTDNISSSTTTIDLKGVKMISIYKPCTSCDEPEYEKKVVNTNSSDSISAVLKKLDTKVKNNINGIGLGENPLKFDLYYSNSISTVIVVNEDVIAIKTVNDADYTLYDLSKGTNIKSYILNLYNTSVSAN